MADSTYFIPGSSDRTEYATREAMLAAAAAQGIDVNANLRAAASWENKDPVTGMYKFPVETPEQYEARRLEDKRRIDAAIASGGRVGRSDFGYVPAYVNPVADRLPIPDDLTASSFTLSAPSESLLPDPLSPNALIAADSPASFLVPESEKTVYTPFYKTTLSGTAESAMQPVTLSTQKQNFSTVSNAAILPAMSEKEPLYTGTPMAPFVVEVGTPVNYLPFIVLGAVWWFFLRK